MGMPISKIKEYVELDEVGGSTFINIKTKILETELNVLFQMNIYLDINLMPYHELYHHLL